MIGKARKRLSPEKRRNQLLDCAQSIIVTRGLSSLTMDLLATEAGVSNPMIYKYFDTRLQVLQELLVREFNGFHESVRRQLADVQDYRDVVRVHVETNFRQFENGNVVSILLGQPDVRAAIKEVERKKTGPYLVKELASRYQLDRSVAQTLIVLASGASLAAAEHYSQYGGDRTRLIDQTVQFIFGGLENLLPGRNRAGGG